MNLNRIAFIDLETTGTRPQKDRITDGEVMHWSQLIHPGCRIPAYIQALTGIGDATVADAPRFEQIASRVLELLDGHLLVAHNAQFDVGFLKQGFKRAGLPFRPEVVCTVKLSRRFDPEHSHHNLDSLIRRHGLEVSQRHRALGDAELLWQLWKLWLSKQGISPLQDAVQAQLRRPSLPPHLSTEDLEDIPDAPGVYRFYGEQEELLYVGKSLHLRQRVLSHFSASGRDSKEFRLGQQTHRIDWQETAGELGALLLESHWIKTLQPIHNRRLRRQNHLCSWQLEGTAETGLAPKLVWAETLDLSGENDCFGLYGSHRQAKQSLAKVAEGHGLCTKVLGLESHQTEGPCFAYQLHRCKGACVGEESPRQHSARLLLALAKIKLKTWPYPGAIGVVETSADGERRDIHLLKNWCHLGTAQSLEELRPLLAQADNAVFDRDSYHLLLNHLRKATGVLDLSMGLPGHPEASR
jgi:DNA polymerase-3 subunit epsilon